MNEFNWPDLRNEPIIGIDFETYDPILKELGCGAFRAKAYGDEYGYVLGIGIASHSGVKHYFSLRHPDSENYDIPIVRDYLNKYVLSGTGVLIGANIQYELAWGYYLGLEFKKELKDVQIAEPLIDEEREHGYSLEALLQNYFGRPKGEMELYNAARIYGIPEKDIKKSLYLFPSRYVSDYCIQDAQDCLDLIVEQEKEIGKQNLGNIYALENKLIPILFEIRKYGVKVDVAKAEELSLHFENEQLILQNKLNDCAGTEIDIWSNDSVATLFISSGIEVPRTQKTTKKNPMGSPSFHGKWLCEHTWEPANLIGEARKLDRLRTTYIGNIAKYHVNGRVHAQINQLASDDYGTRTGRMSCSDPNLYQIPSRGPLANLVRSLFIPDEDCEWVSNDYSAQEPRLAVHYAAKMNLTKAKEFANQFQDKHMDFHNLVLAWVNVEGLTRTRCKTISLGAFYAMGKGKIMAELGVGSEEANIIFTKYHKELPWVKELEKECIRVSESRKYLITLLGRRRHFNYLEPGLRYPDYMDKKRKYRGLLPSQIQAELERLRELPQEEYRDFAIQDWSGNLKPAFCYKALNSLIQGSAADMMKQAIIHIWEEFKNPAYLQVQVYDEVCGSHNNPKDKKKIKEIMENVVKLEVPIVVDTKSGKSWGECVKEIER